MISYTTAPHSTTQQQPCNSSLDFVTGHGAFVLVLFVVVYVWCSAIYPVTTTLLGRTIHYYTCDQAMSVSVQQCNKFPYHVLGVYSDGWNMPLVWFGSVGS